MTKKYLLIDENDGMDIWTECYDTAKEAFEAADALMDHLTQHDLKHRSEIYVATADVEEDGTIDFDTVRLVTQYYSN